MCKTKSLLIVLQALLAFAKIAMVVGAEKIRLDADTMKAALRTATPEESGFIDYVLRQVSKGKIPADLVDSAFQWARKKPYKHRFQYFRQGLLVLAEKQGIKV